MSTALDILHLVTGRQNPYCNAWTQTHAHLDTFNQMIFLSSISCGSACRCKSCCKRFVGAERSGYGFRSIQHRGEVCLIQSNSDIAYLGYCVPSLCTYQMRMTDFELHLTLYIFTPVMRTWLVRTFAYCAQNLMHRTALHLDSAYM